MSSGVCVLGASVQGISVQRVYVHGVYVLGVSVRGGGGGRGMSCHQYGSSTFACK